MKPLIPALGASVLTAVIMITAVSATLKAGSVSAGPVMGANSGISATEAPTVLVAMNEADSVAIDMQARPIPAERRAIRIVGPRFFPDPANALDFGRDR